MIWIPFLIAIVLLFSVYFSIYKQTLIQFNANVARENLLSMVFWSIIFLIFFSGLLLFPQPWDKYSFIAYNAVLVLALLWYLFSWYRRKKTAGYVLLIVDETNQKQKILFYAGIAIAILSIILFIFAFVSVESFNSEFPQVISQAILLGVLAIVLITLRFTKMEFREQGIAYGLRFIQWQKISTYQWETENNNVLKIWVRRHFPSFSGIYELKIPESKKTNITFITEEYIEPAL